MIRRVLAIIILLGVLSVVYAQEISRYIVVDQFGYLPGSKKVAVIRDPQLGFDADESFSPGYYYAVVDAVSGEKIYRAPRAVWDSGKTDNSSGDRAWHFDFSSLTETGTYYILDEKYQVRSYDFVIAHNVYNEVLKQAMRTFYYQRAGFPKEAQFAGEEWADGASHVGDLQDNNCRSFFDKLNPGTEKDVSGGWYDAGDYNKYTNWTANYVVELMKAYMERPQAWGDDYNIPESGNGIPDILDESIWGIDHLLRMQQSDGSVLSIVGEAHASPPSAATEPSYYGPPNTSATLNTSAAFAIASRVYRSMGLINYADTLLTRAIKAWEWAELYPDSLFNNNDPAYESITLGAGTQEVNDYGRFMARMEAACYLFGETGDTMYRDFIDNNYLDVHLFQWTFAYPYEALNQEILLYYTTLPGGTAAVQDHIKDVYRTAMLNGTHNLMAYVGEDDPYRAHLDTYTWGSNGVKSSQGSMYYNLLTYDMNEGLSKTREAAEAYIHYIHGVNPLNFVYLSNMYDYGADNGVNEFYHSWFTNGSPLWDRVGTSTYGPPPGYLTGGANPGYDRDGCCPSNCGSSSNNSKCTSESISPPKNQPPQKSYKDFNTSWPLNSWSVTENSCGYQVRYIRLLSKFVTAGMDCNGEVGGEAFIDSCGDCAGGTTGLIPSLETGNCADIISDNSGDTMFISGRHLYSAAGERVILRGVNEMFVWSDDKRGEKYLPEIAQTGANCVRLVWTAEYGNENALVDLIENCISHKMIAMPECHSATGEWDNLDICVNFWNNPALIEGIQRNKRWTLLNIGNEVGDGNVSAEQFLNGYKRAIDSLRGWGYTVPIVIDASTWGQNVDVILDTWEEIQEYDPLNNVLFSVHSYWSNVNNYQKVATASVNDRLAVIIGEGPSPTAYPTCNILDYGTGLESTGKNDIGWLSWSWGGMPNGHCIPNFDHTYDGIFGAWRTTYAADMMVDHPYSLMRTASRPASFYPGDTVIPSGIYLAPDQDSIIVGDTLSLEVLLTPVNAYSKEFTLTITGDEDAVNYQPETGKLVAVAKGYVEITVRSVAVPNLVFSRNIQVLDIPVSSLTFTPSAAHMLVDDTLYFEVELLPENATDQEYLYKVLNPEGAIAVDTLAGMVLAKTAGTASIIVEWNGGEVSDTLHIAVTENTSGEIGRKVPEIILFPNPNEGLLYITNDQLESFELQVLDLSGKLFIETRYTGKTMIDTSILPGGTYVVLHKGMDMVLRHKLIMI